MGWESKMIKDIRRTRRKAKKNIFFFNLPCDTIILKKKRAKH